MVKNQIIYFKNFVIVLFIFLVLLLNSCFGESNGERINKFINTLNNGAAATMNNISFSCLDCDAEKPILIIKSTVQCLECEKCFLDINNFLGESFLLISEVWFKHFGTYRINIINHVDKLVFIINDKHELIRPLPLPKEYV